MFDHVRTALLNGFFPFARVCCATCDNRLMIADTDITSGPARPTLVLGVTGCIAAYKACELVRALVKQDVRVKVVMTQAATRFVGPVTFRTLSDEPVTTSLWDDPGSSAVHHVSLAEEADVMLIAPCTANVMAKLASGRADDILSTTALATEATIILAPAMNTHMWRHTATRANLETLRSRGVIVVEPDAGELACGDVGEGRLAALERILEVTQAELSRSRDLVGVRALVTAGPTLEPLDPVRFLGNRSTGKQGYAVAEELGRRGARVVLVSGPTSLPDPFGVTTIRVNTALEMQAAANTVYGDADVVVSVAAVSDFRPEHVAGDKIKKDDAPEALVLVRNPDILAEFGADKGERFLVGFAAETVDTLEHARQKLVAKNLDLVVANDVSEPGAGFGHDTNRVVFVTHEGDEHLSSMTKGEVARRIADKISARTRKTL